MCAKKLRHFIFFVLVLLVASSCKQQNKQAILPEVDPEYDRAYTEVKKIVGKIMLKYKGDSTFVKWEYHALLDRYNHHEACQGTILREFLNFEWKFNCTSKLDETDKRNNIVWRGAITYSWDDYRSFVVTNGDSSCWYKDGRTEYRGKGSQTIYLEKKKGKPIIFHDNAVGVDPKFNFARTKEALLRDEIARFLGLKINDDLPTWL